MNKDKRNNIKLLGTLNNADESGIIANANQIYDANENKSTQDVSKEHTERIKTLETKENSMQITLENITKTGEASAASNVTYNHSDSKLDATNVQQAIDEVNSISHFAKRGGIVNISTNYNSTNTVEVLTLEQAIAKVPTNDRVLGFQCKFLTNTGWENYIFIGNSIANWNDKFKWNRYYTKEESLRTFKIFPKGNCYINKDYNIIYFNSSTIASAQGIAVFKLKKNVNFKISNIWYDEKLAYKVFYLNSNRIIIGHSNNADIINSDVEINSNDLINDAPEGSEFFAVTIEGNSSILYSNIDLRDNTDIVFGNALNNLISDLKYPKVKNIIFGFKYTEQNGYLNKTGNYENTEEFKSKTTIKYYCKPGDVFLYKGIGEYNTQSWIFYNENYIVGYGQVKSTNSYTEVTIPENVNKVIFSSYSNKSNEVILDVKCKSDIKFHTRIEDSIIDGNGLQKNLRYFQLHTYKGYYINKTGDIVKYIAKDADTSAQGITPLLRLYPNLTLQISNYWNDTVLGSDVAFFDLKYNLIGVSNDFGYTSYDIINLNTNDLIKIAPKGSIYFTLNIKSKYCTLICNTDISCYGDFITKNLSNNTVEELIAKGLSYTEQDGYFSKQGDYIDTETYHSKTSIKYKCKKGYRFFYKGFGNYNTVSWVFYKNNSIINYGQAESLDDYTEVVVPDGVNSIIFSSYALKSSSVILDVKFNINTNSNSNSNSNNCNILYSKKWYCCGDSYSEGDYTNSPNPENTKFTNGIYVGKNKVYSRFIALRNNMNLQLLAKCGATCGAWKEDVEAGTVDTPTHTNTFYHNQLPKILAKEDETFNGYITLWFCINDSGHCTLGTINDETVNTFYGALNWSAIQLITNFPLAKIGFIVSNNANSSYQQAVREVAQKWAIPYLDMEGDLQIPTISGKRTNQDIPVDSRVRTLRWDNNFRVASNNGHPNEKAHEYQSTFIENWLKSL